MTQASQIILDEIEARLVELRTDAGNVSRDNDDAIPLPLESDESSDEEETEDSSDNDEDG